MANNFLLFFCIHFLLFIFGWVYLLISAAFYLLRLVLFVIVAAKSVLCVLLMFPEIIIIINTNRRQSVFWSVHIAAVDVSWAIQTNEQLRIFLDKIKKKSFFHQNEQYVNIFCQNWCIISNYQKLKLSYFDNHSENRKSSSCERTSRHSRNAHALNDLCCDRSQWIK